jgi:hypothetical protein
MPRPFLALCSCLLGLVAFRTVAAACPDTEPSFTSPCGPLFTLPQRSDSGGWDRRSSYYTIQLGDVDGRPGDELLGHSPVGVWVERFYPEGGQWGRLATEAGGVALPLTDVGAPDDTGGNTPRSSATGG